MIGTQVTTSVKQIWKGILTSSPESVGNSYCLETHSPDPIKIFFFLKNSNALSGFLASLLAHLSLRERKKATCLWSLTTLRGVWVLHLKAPNPWWMLFSSLCPPYSFLGTSIEVLSVLSCAEGVWWWCKLSGCFSGFLRGWLLGEARLSFWD